MSRTFHSLGYRNFRLWFTGNIIASTGTWMQRVAQDWLVLTVLTDHSGFQMGVVTALQFLPLLFLYYAPRLKLFIMRIGTGFDAAAILPRQLPGLAQRKPLGAA